MREMIGAEVCQVTRLLVFHAYHIFIIEDQIVTDLPSCCYNHYQVFKYFREIFNIS